MSAGGFPVLVMSFCLAVASQAFAQPVNDHCGSAIPMTLGTVYRMSTATATSTKDPTEVCGGPFGRSVWFSLTPPQSGMLTLSTCGSDFDTAFQVYTGRCTNLTPVLCSDDFGPACPTHKASADFLVYAGVTYRIVVGGYAGASGNLELVATMPRPPNDECSGAIPLTSGVPITVNTANATTTNDPFLYCSPYAINGGVWFSFTPSNTDLVTIDTGGSDLQTLMGIYTGACGNLRELQCATSRVQFFGTNGTTYFILVGGINGGPGGNIRIMAVEGTPPNDDCAGAIPMSEGVTYRADAFGASDDTPPGACYHVAGVWYSFTPPADSIVTVSTCGSDPGTSLQVFSGSCTSLVPVVDGCQTIYGACSNNEAVVAFRGSAGVTYRFLAACKWNLNIRATTAPIVPNDTCTGAIAMSVGVTYAADTTRASSDGDPRWSCTPLGHGVWYTFTPATNGIVTISTYGSDFDTVLQVFTGSCGSFRSIVYGCNDNSFKGTAGVTYFVLAGGANGAVGNLSISASIGSPLPNDDCSGAIAMTEGVVYTQSTTNATFGSSTKDVWYRFRPTTNCIVTISTCGSDYAPALSIFFGSDCQSLYTAELIPGFDPPPCPTNAASTSFRGRAGLTYWIQVWSSNTGGTLAIQATASPALPNDDCSGAAPLEFGQVYSESTATATSQGDPSVYYGSLTKGVWFCLTPRTSDKVTISTCGSDFDTILEVYSGSCGSLVPITTGFGHFDKPPCNQGRATAIFSATANTTYFILVGGFSGITGNLKILASVPVPPNGDFSGAIPLLANRTTMVNTTYVVSTNQVIPDCGTGFSNGVWFTFVAPTNTEVTLDTCGSDFPTVLEVYTGDYPSLQPVACNAGNGPVCPFNLASLSFFGVTGKRYTILAGGQGATGNLSIVAHVPPPPPPPNALCSSALPLADGIAFSMDTTSALSLGDWLPACRTNFGHAVWFSYKPPSDGPVSISTCGSDFDTVLQVYSGTCAALIPLACNDDSGPVCASNQASVSFIASAQTNYLILAGGYAGAAGNLNITATGLPPPPNRDCASAIPMLTGVPYGGNTFDAPTPNTRLPLCQTNFGHALWYTFTPPVSGLVGVSTCGSDFDTVLQVFTGNCGSLIPLDGGCNDDSGPFCGSVNASVCFMGTAGTKHWLLVGGYGTNWGNLEIAAGVLPPMTFKLDQYYFTALWPTNAGDIHIDFTTNLTAPVVWKPWYYYTDGTNFVAPAYRDYVGPKVFFRLRP